MIGFDLKSKALIIVPVELVGPLQTVVVHMALDTAATHFAVSPAYLTFAGYSPEKGNRQTVMTAGGNVAATLVEVSRISLLGQSTTRFKVLAQHFDPRLGIDGLIGLNMLKRLRKRLILDFSTNQVDLC